MSLPPTPSSIEARPINTDVIFSRAQRAHSRLSWETRLARNVRSTAASQVTIKLFGVPRDFAELIGLKYD